MGTLDIGLADLGPDDLIADFVRAVAEKRAVVSDRRSNYLSLRPAGEGAIAIWVFKHRIGIATDPYLAEGLARSIVGAVLDKRTPATTDIIISADSVSVYRETVLDLALRAIDWRAVGPRNTLGDERSGRLASALEICPTCRMEISVAGRCFCD